MKDRYLEVTFRKGKPLAAYLYLPRDVGVKSARTVQGAPGILVDYSKAGAPIGVEITAPEIVTLEEINTVLNGNTLPHLHLHVFPRYLGDPFEGRPIDPRAVAGPVYAPGEFLDMRRRVMAGRSEGCLGAGDVAPAQARSCWLGLQLIHEGLGHSPSSATRSRCRFRRLRLTRKWVQ